MKFIYYLDQMKFEYFPKGCAFSKKSSGLMSLSEIVAVDADALVDSFRNGDTKAKKSIPAICPQGDCDETKERSVDHMRANHFCMVDLDHMPFSYEELRDLVENKSDDLQQNNVVLAYITCSGKGLRFILPVYEGLNIQQSALLFVKRVYPDLLQYLDTVTTDISRLSILTKRRDYLYLTENEKLETLTPSDEELKFAIRDIKTYIDSLKNNSQAKADNQEGEDVKDEKPLNATDTDNQNRPYKSYTKEMVEQNDRLYADVRYKGRRVVEIAECYISYKTKGMGPEAGERHALYSLMCKNFRNLVDNNPCVLHAVLPQLGHEIDETWRQCYYYTSRSQSSMLPKDFYFWMKSHGMLEYRSDNEDVVSEEDQMYDKFLNELPPLPPIIREFVKTAPKWFKLPCIASLQCYLALLCTNHRSYYFDGMPISTTLYTLVYAPAASGKSYVRKLKTILKSTDARDKLAIEKAKWYDKQQRQNNGSGKLPEEVVWKQRLFASKTSLGEILKRQEAIGEHHWLQDVGEFSIWAATIKKNKEEWSAFFRTSYDNEEFSQSYQSANAYRGKVAVFPIVHGTCTIGQINSFFTNVEDGLLSRFSFIPLLHQRFASYQPWKIMSDYDQARIDRVLKRLDWETYADVDLELDPSEVDEDYKEGETKKNDDGKEWDYEFKDPIYHDLSYVHEALIAWLEQKRKDAKKDGNDALDTFRRRCARNAFAYAIICRALFGRNDKKTREKIVANALWDAEVKLYYMRYIWEEAVNDELANGKNNGKSVRKRSVFDDLPQNFNKQALENALMSSGYKTPAKQLLYLWKSEGLIKETSKNSYQKI